MPRSAASNQSSPSLCSPTLVFAATPAKSVQAEVIIGEPEFKVVEAEAKIAWLKPK